MALRTGIAPSELLASPELYEAIVDELNEADDERARERRREQMRQQLR